MTKAILHIVVSNSKCAKRKLRCKAIIVLNEKEFAENCLQNGLGESKPFFVLSILARYYFHHCGFRKKKISHLLLEYLETYYPKFKENEFEWKETVSKLAAKAGIHKLLKISGVSITKSEMETICSIKNKLLERLAFTMLCIAKFNNCKNPQNDGWVNTDIKDIFDYARIVCNSYERAVKIGELRQRGLLCFAKRSDSLNCRVTFIDDNFEEELFVSDFRELGYEYLKYKGGNFIRCNECGLLVRASKSDNGKYCRFCMSNIPTPKKTLKCVDCGISFEVDMKNHKTRRCKACSARRRRELIKQSVRNYREKQM